MSPLRGRAVAADGSRVIAFAVTIDDDVDNDCLCYLWPLLLRPIPASGTEIDYIRNCLLLDCIRNCLLLHYIRSCLLLDYIRNCLLLDYIRNCFLLHYIRLLINRIRLRIAYYLDYIRNSILIVEVQNPC